MSSFFTQYRLESDQSLHRYINGEAGLLVSSMVFGGSSGLPKDLSHSFSVIGMQHVMAASGFNVALIAQLAMSLSSRFWGRQRAGFFALICIFFYVGVAGGTASVVRAGLMLSFGILVAQILLRQVKAWWTLALTCVCMLTAHPAYLQEIGFQLSVSATLGLILVTPLFEPQSFRKDLELGLTLPVATQKHSSLLHKLIAIARDSAATTVAAQSLSLPLILHHFGELSLLSLPANVLLLWLTPIITIGGVWLVLISNLSSMFGNSLELLLRLFGLLLGSITNFFIEIVTWLGQWQNTLYKLPNWSWKQVWLSWSLVTGLVWLHSRRKT